MNSSSWYAVTVLMIANVVAITDRQLLSLLVEPIRRDLGISDLQMSLLGGPAFAVFYTCFALPIAWVADRTSRRLVIAAGIALWSVMTALCGLASRYTHLLLARVGVGVGEASLGPAAQSLISDLFPGPRLGKAMALYHTGSAIGTGIALLFGGAAIALVQSLPAVTLPGFGALRDWQLAFIVVGLPGVFVALLVSGIREPGRQRAAAASATIPRGSPSDGDGFVRFLLSNRRAFAPLAGGFCAALAALHAFFMWLPALFMRTHGWNAARTGMATGTVLLTFGIAGAMLAGWYADRCARAGRQDSAIRVTVTATIVAIPCGVLMPLLPEPWAALVLLSLLALALWAIGASFPTAIMLVTPSRYRARTSALAYLVGNLVGMGLGPPTVAVLTDHWFSDPFALPYSMAITMGTFLSVAAICFGIAAARYPGAGQTAQAANGARD